jgi:hypothetical protein
VFQSFPGDNHTEKGETRPGEPAEVEIRLFRGKGAPHKRCGFGIFQGFRPKARPRRAHGVFGAASQINPPEQEDSPLIVKYFVIKNTHIGSLDLFNNPVGYFTSLAVFQAKSLAKPRFLMEFVQKLKFLNNSLLYHNHSGHTPPAAGRPFFFKERN